MLTLTIPAVKELRKLLSEGNFGKYLANIGERSGVGSVRVVYTLKKCPWVITIEAKRKRRNCS